MAIKPIVLDRITQHYIQSRDFNGISGLRLAEDLAEEPADVQAVVAELIREGKVAAVFGDIHPNPHIRAFPDVPIEDQLEKLQQKGLSQACLYPTTTVLSDAVDPQKFQGRPFTLKLALGEPQLAFYAFDLMVLEFYRNDPRYRYTHNDVGGTIGVRDEYDQGTAMPEQDKLLLQTFGFAYDDDLNRAVAVFVRYLADLPPEHQQVWHARILGTAPQYKLHPDYYRASILGKWRERISLFQAFSLELRAIKGICERIGWPPLFRDDFAEEKRPREFGFLLRPTLKEFNDFVQLLDKMISENINRDFFVGQVPLERDELRSDGKTIVIQKGTIQLLDEWLRRYHFSGKLIEDMIAAIKEVRELRMRPAHAIDEDAFDMQLFKRQRELMIRVYDGVRTLRLVLASHPKARGYQVSESIREGKIWTR